MKRVRESDQPLSGVPTIPVIGVALIVLIVLMVISPIVNIPGLAVDLPEAVSRETKEQNITVSLTADGFISIDSLVVEWKDLPRELRAVLGKRTNDDFVIIVRADKELPYGAVEKLLRVVNQNAGTRAVAVATRQRSTTLEAAIQ